MAVVSKFRSAFRRQTTDDAVTTVNVNTVEETKSQPPVDGASAEINRESGSEDAPPRYEAPDENTQRGVADMEAITQTWSKWTLYAVFVKYVILILRPS